MIKIGDIVKVKLHKQYFHEGVYLGMDALGNHKVGVTKTNISSIALNPRGKKYISIFNTKFNKLILVKEA